ncbi:MAG: class I SAM-dependent methyltransferase [Myxococcota bacterium]
MTADRSGAGTRPAPSSKAGLEQSKRQQKKAEILQRRQRELEPFDKYWHYITAVQDPNGQAAELAEIYRDARGRALGRGAKGSLGPSEPRTLREDFCGTFVNCCAWVASGPDKVAHGVDLDPEPLAYGREHFLPGLSERQRQRVHVHQKNVLDDDLPSADIICALNFSYFLLRTRKDLLRYFRGCHAKLEVGGILVLDVLGGPDNHDISEEETDWSEHGFKYIWDQVSFDPITHEATFHIHFKRKGEQLRERVFSYQWRLWTLPELRDLLDEAGFSKVEVLWEGEDEEGEGDGIFTVADHAEPCSCWNAYIVASR